jgi:hypothetical protein
VPPKLIQYQKYILRVSRRLENTWTEGREMNGYGLPEFLVIERKIDE